VNEIVSSPIIRGSGGISSNDLAYFGFQKFLKDQLNGQNFNWTSSHVKTQGREP